MKDNFEQCIALVLREEGGFVNNPHDPGGMTNMGVTKASWEMYVQHPVTEDEMRKLTLADVIPFYRTNYWDTIRGDSLPDGIDYAVFDMAVNSGVGRAAKTLQAVLGVKADGSIGPATIAACEAANARDVTTQFCEKRLAFLQGLPTWNTFGKGWGSRVARVEELAFKMAS